MLFFEAVKEFSGLKKDLEKLSNSYAPFLGKYLPYKQNIQFEPHVGFQTFPTLGN